MKTFNTLTSLVLALFLSITISAQDCDVPVWEVVSPTPNSNAFNNNGEWAAIANGFSANGYCGGGCVEPVSTWLVYGPLNLNNSSALNLTFDAAENFGNTDLIIAYTTNYSSACPANASWTTAGTVTNPGAVDVDLSSAAGTEVYIGIEYTDDGMDGYSDWDLTNFQLLSNNCPSVGTPIVSNCGTNFGCTDMMACNYNANANLDDGSCFSIGDVCDDNNSATTDDVISSACICEGTSTGLANCGTPAWEVISPTPNLNAFNNFGQWEIIDNGFSANGYCGGGCVEPVSTWLVYGPLNLTNTSTLNLVFDADKNFDITDLVIAYTDDYTSACPTSATWTTAGIITDSGAANIDLSAASGTQVYIGIDYTDDGVDGFADWNLTDFQLLADNCPAVGTPIVSNCDSNFGCTDAMACNFDVSAGFDDGSCFYVGDTCDDELVNTTNDVINDSCECMGTPIGGGNCATDALINEFHYDNAGTDMNEFIEIALPANEDPSQIRVDLYNGSNGASYEVIVLSTANFVSSDGVFDYYVWNPTIIQNGNDGIALSCLDGTLYQFITYEGAFMASDGPFAGEMGIDVGVEENSDMTDIQSIMYDGMGNYVNYCIASAGSTNDLANCGCDPEINNNCVSTCTQTINLNPGWNLISLDVSLADKTIASVFSDIIDNSNLEFITGFNSGIKTFDPDRPFFLNSLIEVADGFGYWVKVTNTDALFFEGDCLADDFRKPLDAGWNLVAYPPDSSQSPAMYFADLITDGNLEFVTGFNDGIKTFDPNRPAFLNTLLQMENGFGYWVKVINPAQ